MQEIRAAFKAAFSSDSSVYYGYWESHREKIRIQTYVAIALTCIVATVCWIASEKLGLWLFGAASVVFLLYHFCNSTYVVASTLPEHGDGETVGRAEYFETMSKYASGDNTGSPLFFIAPHFLYISIAITLFLILLNHTK